ncbi:MAG: cobalamin-binding protein [Desulfobacterales bacterium]|jgi:iron complex transport system substrate-binding protein|nr:cobalamin-binding protein [Desulfobacterales bacterium]
MKQYRLIAILIVLSISGFSFDTEAREVSDAVNRRVTVPDLPKRVVALAPSVTEIVFAIGRQDLLKGVTQYSNYPPEAGAIYKVGSYVKLDLERIVALKPDLCIATKDGNPKEIVERLMSLGICVYVIDPRSLDTMLDSITQIGVLLNATDAACALVRSLQNRIDEVARLVANVEHRPKVFIQIGVTPIVSVGTQTFIHELIERAGGVNLARGDTPYPRFSREQVLALAPEVIIITSMDRAAVFEQIKAQWSRWPTIQAAKNQRIYVEDSDLFDRPTPRLVDALERLIRLIHPALFKEVP